MSCITGHNTQTWACAGLSGALGISRGNYHTIYQDYYKCQRDSQLKVNRGLELK